MACDTRRRATSEGPRRVEERVHMAPVWPAEEQRLRAAQIRPDAPSPSGSAVTAPGGTSLAGALYVALADVFAGGTLEATRLAYAGTRIALRVAGEERTVVM